MTQPAQQISSKRARLPLSVWPLVIGDVCGLAALALPWFRPSVVLKSSSGAYLEHVPSKLVHAHDIRWWHFGLLGALIFVPLLAFTAIVWASTTGRYAGPVPWLLRRAVPYGAFFGVAMGGLISLMRSTAPRHATFTLLNAQYTDDWNGVRRDAASALSLNPQPGFWLLVASNALLLVAVVALAVRYRGSDANDRRLGVVGTTRSGNGIADDAFFDREPGEL